MKTEQKRTFYLDVARVIAIISISLNHAVNRSYDNYKAQMNEFFAIPLWSTLFKAIITVFSHIGVPLFLMITGVLILNKKIENGTDVKRFYKHNLFSLLVTAEIWYVIMYWLLVIRDGLIAKQGWLDTVSGMFSTMVFLDQTTQDCMWYMPMILCVYTTLPFVVMVKDKLSGSKEKVWLLPVVVLFVVGMVVPFANGLLTLLGKDTVTTPLMESYLFSFFYIYIIVGYLVGKGLLSKLRTWTVGIGALGTFLICCGYQLWAYEQPANYLVAYDFPLIPVCAAFVFELVRRCAHRFKKAEKPITGMSRIAFAIYFMHIIIMTDMVEVLNRFAPGLMAPVRLLVLEITSVGLSVAVILPLSKIKVLRRYLFLIK